MLELQRTIAKQVSMNGTGLHTGTECKLTFKPAPENHGIKFVRADLGGKPEIPAIADNVIDVFAKHFKRQDSNSKLYPRIILSSIRQ
jgi:UDP-3-O-[3-hydroxymyristoyl] N-acetylglucosamine deacetylase/3-hydroxyacyl-[acyl-carrier-protein] dehydratase